MEDLVAVGDWVEVSPLPGGEGMIDAIEIRQRVLSRLAPTPRGDYRQIIIANPDQAAFVFACMKPEPHPGMLDRFLVVAEKQQIPSIIVVNKVDLLGIAQAEALFKHYSSLGYPVIYTSAHSGVGIEELTSQLTGKLSVLAGPSGVGKTSLLNSIQPGLGLAVRTVSRANDKGRHTTVVRQLFPLNGGGYVADTPGLKAMALWDILPEELDGYFPELRRLVGSCQFNNCTHIHEPGCAVLAAVGQGEVNLARYESYVRMRQSQDEY
jgi:ribosome biogenesis GTPase / thiamine phosphate phosphatase